MVVSFTTEHEEVACTLFEQAFDKLIPTGRVFSKSGAHYEFEDDVHLLDARHWLGDALGCGLIMRGSIEVTG